MKITVPPDEVSTAVVDYVAREFGRPPEAVSVLRVVRKKSGGVEFDVDIDLSAPLALPTNAS